MLATATVFIVALGVLALTASYRHREAILAREPIFPSAALTSVLALDSAAALLCGFVGSSHAPSWVLLALPLTILGGYIGVVVLVLGIRAEWGRSTLFLLGAFAPFWGAVFAFLVFASEKGKGK